MLVILLKGNRGPNEGDGIASIATTAKLTKGDFHGKELIFLNT